ncbi:hypothetical protein [Leisingera sp.]|uniref:hypothetical protein n=1 Tax=Leisingera sp. TaxID=1879318 RepID=UPI002B26E8EA|nr:hypothetical protein [Leisingera sp.]
MATAIDQGTKPISVAKSVKSERQPCSALREFTSFKASQPQRTAETVGCAAAQNFGWLRQTAEVAKGASCASLHLLPTAAFKVVSQGC